jgi:hypothetical protein
LIAGKKSNKIKEANPSFVFIYISLAVLNAPKISIFKNKLTSLRVVQINLKNLYK